MQEDLTLDTKLVRPHRRRTGDRPLRDGGIEEQPGYRRVVGGA